MLRPAEAQRQIEVYRTVPASIISLTVPTIMKDYLFVYGSLRSPCQVPEPIAAVANRFIRLGLGKVNGRLYDLGEFCGAVLDSTGTSVVHGELVELPSDEDLLGILDRYEEIDPLHPANGLFWRQRTTVHLSDGSDKEAWIYTYNRAPGNAPLILGGDYQQFKGKA